MRIWLLILLVGLAGCIEPPPSQILNPGLDMSPDDMSADTGADMDSPNVCNPEDEGSACQRLNTECGSVTFNDRCVGQRTISCGTCLDNENCLVGVCDDGQIGDETFCRENEICGTVMRGERMVECGDTCEAPETCGAVLPNRCGCQGESTGELCVAAGNPCGPSEFTDSCGELVVATCSTCTEPLSCGGGGQAGVCGCTPQSDAQICAHFEKNCDNLAVIDNCGDERTVNCGTCTSPQTCGFDGVPNRCGGAGCTPSSKEKFCQDLGKNCGSIIGTDNCGMIRTEDCGMCTSPETCGGGGTQHICGCTYEGNLAFCSRYSKQCGSVSGIDNCGMGRTVNCGACPDGQSCDLSGSCQTTCVPEDDATFCTRLNACGQTTAMDNCGTYRTRDCTCQNGALCSNGKCGGIVIGSCNGVVCIPPTECRPTDPPHCCDPSGPDCQ